MSVVEIHIKDNVVESVEGQNVYVYIHDHDVKQTTTMTFKKQEDIYDRNRKNNQTVWTGDVEKQLDNRKK